MVSAEMAHLLQNTQSTPDPKEMLQSGASASN